MDLGELKSQLINWFGCKCYWCGSRGPVALHHIVERNSTSKHTVARDLSEVSQLVALLCPQHHDYAHRFPEESRGYLFRKMYRKPALGGYEAIKAAYDKLNEVAPIGWELPAYEW